MYTLNDAKLDCIKEFKALGLPTPDLLWLDFIIKLVVEDYYKQDFILDGAMKNVGLKIKPDGEIPINENFAKDIIVNAVLGCYYSDKDEDEMYSYANNVMVITLLYDDFLRNNKGEDDDE